MTKKWIQKSIKHKGALRKLAEKENAITKRGTISLTWLRRQSRRKDIIGKRAKLALRLIEYNKKHRR